MAAEELTVCQKIRQRRFVVVSLPELGHLMPIFHIGRQLRARGHEVQLVTCKFLVPKLEALCAQHGIELVAICRGMQAPESGQGEAARIKRSRKILNLYIHYSRMMHNGLKNAARSFQPHAIITDYMTLSGCWVGDELNIPVAVNMSDTVLMDISGPSPSPWHPYVMLFRGPFVMKRSIYFMNSAVFQICSMICESLYRRVIFANSFWGLHEVKMMPPNVYFTGPVADRDITFVEATPDEEINQWLEEMRAAQKPVVYVSFGTMVELSEHHVRCLYYGLEAIEDIAVAWSLRHSQQRLLPIDISKAPRRFYIHHWFPQPEMIAHESVVAVVAHCGFGGVSQVIACGKPLVAMPFSGDQPRNAAKVKSRGMCEVLDKDRLKPEDVERAARKVMSDPSYKAKAEQMQTALHTSRGSWACAIHAEHLATYGCEYITRQPPRMLPYTIRAAGMLALVAASLGYVHHLRSKLKAAGVH